MAMGAPTIAKLKAVGPALTVLFFQAYVSTSAITPLIVMLEFWLAVMEIIKQVMGAIKNAMSKKDGNAL